MRPPTGSRPCSAPAASREQVSERPPIAGPRELPPTVEPELDVLPELEPRRDEPEPAPERRTWHGPHAELQRVAGDLLLEGPRSVHRLGLAAGPRADLAPAGPAREVVVGFGLRDPL